MACGGEPGGNVMKDVRWYAFDTLVYIIAAAELWAGLMVVIQ